jgi:hypothetical protein
MGDLPHFSPWVIDHSLHPRDHGGMDLFLRKVDLSDETDGYRVVLTVDSEEFEIGSIQVQPAARVGNAWAWCIDAVLPMQTHQSNGRRGFHRGNCMARFRAAWALYCDELGWLDEFLALKRRHR